MQATQLIVIAEDNEDTRRVYALILRHHGFEVAEATNGLEAVELVRRTKPSLVLMDIGLPEIDGWQASRLLKSDGRTNTIPLIAFSACVDSTADLNGRATFDGYILKPISPNELVRRVQAYMKLLRVDGQNDRSAQSPGRYEESTEQAELAS